MVEQGYSLLELLAVAALAGLGLAIALPAIVRIQARSELQASADQVAQDVALARLRAVERRAGARLVYDGSARTYRLDPGGPVRRLAGQVSASAFPAVVFDPSGLLSPAAPLEIGLASPAGTRRVTVSAAGAVRVR